MAERGHLMGRHQPSVTYEQDYAAWVAEQVLLLREGRGSELDFANLAEEVEDLGKSDFRRLTSALEVVPLHMLKWDYQPALRSKSWILSIKEHRLRIAKELNASPSYRNRTGEALEGVYDIVCLRAARETQLPVETFPETCPYSWDQTTSREHPLDGEA